MSYPVIKRYGGILNVSLRERRPTEKAPKLFAILVLISLSARDIENTIIYYNGNI